MDIDAYNWYKFCCPSCGEIKMMGIERHLPKPSCIFCFDCEDNGSARITQQSAAFREILSESQPPPAKGE